MRSPADEPTSGFGPSVPQPHKLYIKIMQKTPHVAQLETQLLQYFRDFGPVEDLKVLKNSGLKRKRQTIRIRVLCRRNERVGSPEPRARVEWPQSELISLH